MILIAYDGSDDAKAAIAQAAELVDGHPVTVLTVWEPFVEVMSRAPVGFGLVPSLPDPMEIDEASALEARQRAEEGAALAREAGLNAQAATCAKQSTTSQAILTEAERIGASAVLMGSRGLTGMKSLLLGSVSHAVIQHADLPVIVVPSPSVAAGRTRARREMEKVQ